MPDKSKLVEDSIAAAATALDAKFDNSFLVRVALLSDDQTRKDFWEAVAAVALTAAVPVILPQYSDQLVTLLFADNPNATITED